MQTVRIAIAGLGKAFRDIHLPAYRKIKRLEIVGGVDPYYHGVDIGFPLFSSVEEMLEKTSPQILSVVTPPQSHFQLVQTGLQAGCHVFCEKPFMADLEEADSIIDLSVRNGRWVVINNQYRFMNIHREAKRQIGSEQFGDLLFLSAEQMFYVTDTTELGWRGKERFRTCKEFGTHVLDLCRFFFDDEPHSILARMPRGNDPNNPDFLNLIQVEFPGDRVAHVTLDRLCRGPHNYLNIRLDGSNGCLQTHLGGRMEMSAGIRGGTRKPYFGFDVSMGGHARLYQGEKSRKIAADPLDVFATATSRLMHAFLLAIDQGATPPNSAQDNRSSLALMLAACESGETNERVVFSNKRQLASESDS